MVTARYETKREAMVEAAKLCVACDWDFAIYTNILDIAEVRIDPEIPYYIGIGEVMEIPRYQRNTEYYILRCHEDDFSYSWESWNK